MGTAHIMRDAHPGLKIKQIVLPCRKGKTMSTHRIEFKAFGLGLAAAIVASNLLCAAVAVVLPTYQATHNWLLLFSPAEVGSLRNLVEGIVNGIIVSWIFAAVFTAVYNRFSGS
jgi:uncharacterized protein YqhQ